MKHNTLHTAYIQSTLFALLLCLYVVCIVLLVKSLNQNDCTGGDKRGHPLYN